MAILQFPIPQHYAHRRTLSAIPTGYRARVRVAASVSPWHWLLSQLWTLLLVVALIWMAIDLASAAPSPTTSSAPIFSSPAPTTSTLSTPRHHATPTAPADTDDIRDIRGPVHIAPSWLWLAYLAGAAALAAGAYFLYRWWRSRSKARAKLPFEIALEALERARAFMTVEKAREYSFTVSEITRNYIEQRFGTRAAHRTTEEFLHDLVSKPTGGLAEHAGALEEFLKHCDMVKFARWSLTQEEMEAMHASAVAFVNRTRPQQSELEKKTPSTPAAATPVS